MGKEESPQVTKRTTRSSPLKTCSRSPLSEEMGREELPQVTKRTTRSSPFNTFSRSPLSEEMGREESPQVTRRTTRSSLNTCSNKTRESQKSIDCRPPSVLNDLVSEEEPISLDVLLSNFPGRRLQILELLHLLGPLNSPMPPLFLYGGASTGKTSAILQIFRHLKRPFIYSSCRTCYNQRILFETTLNQLLLHRRNASNGYSSAKRCERPADFVNFLREGVTEVINNLRESSSKSGSKETEEQGTGRMVYFIFDNMELVREWDKHLGITSMLFKLYEILKMPEVGLIFISNSSLDTYHLNTGFVEPIPILFPDYTEEDLNKIFMRNQAKHELYSSFLDFVLKPFCRITKRVDELSIAFRPLFQKYCEPLSDTVVVPTKDMKRRLFNHLQPHILPALNETFKVPSHPSLEVEANKEKFKRKGNTRKLGDMESADEIDFHMPVSAKYLLISAFLASRNPATLDAALFDSTGGGDNRKRKRKISETSKEKKENAEQELLMKGPGTFPLERLLAIFQCITSVAEFSLEEEQQVDDSVLGMAEGGGGDNGLMSDVLLQLSTLCNANFISRGGNCPLEGSTRYRSTVSEEMTLKVARSVKFPLSKYLYRR
ncbi:Origin recognition complex [Macleaya cordata]|uniref:Origin recognition complex n=1 Tax=Macleaya cordata TaxID=56857 RepID=A0A200RB55_MACCD|nr:Origin recognition complex [Macleaya cordata]